MEGNNSEPNPLDVMEDSKAKIAGHLESPKKKRRDFAVLAFSDSLDPDVALVIEGYIKNTFKSLTIVKPKSKKDLGVMVTKNVRIVLIDDNFLWEEDVFDELISIKSKRSSVVPTLFLTDDENRLVLDYKDKMSAFQEVDGYVLYRKLSTDQLLARVQNCIKFKNRRASRRHKVDVPVRYYNLTDDSNYVGKLIDISIHGAVLKDDTDHVFKVGDQIRVSIPVDGLFEYENGEFFKVSAKVRRVIISGDSCGISWEYLTAEHQKYITSYVVAISQREVEKKQFRGRMKNVIGKSS